MMNRGVKKKREIFSTLCIGNTVNQLIYEFFFLCSLIHLIENCKVRKLGEIFLKKYLNHFNSFMFA